MNKKVKLAKIALIAIGMITVLIWLIIILSLKENMTLQIFLDKGVVLISGLFMIYLGFNWKGRQKDDISS